MLENAFTSRHVGVAAEAIVAAQFARMGYDVSVQYGANQPEYDLVVVAGHRLLKVSVKGSKDGSWGLTQSYLMKGKADYRDAADRWLRRHTPQTAICFVQFHGVAFNQLPRTYLATPAEVVSCLHMAAKGRGDTILHEAKVWAARAYGAGTEDRIPAAWCLPSQRVQQILEMASNPVSPIGDDTLAPDVPK